MNEAAELARLELAYDRALRRACSERSPEGIASAFDEADRLQWRLLVTTRRARTPLVADGDRR
jgi:hypothetical protein